jgi:outer membrane receptor for ferrienterochelin and colicins
MSRHFIRRLGGSLFLVALVPLCLPAQQPTGAIAGVVTDQSGPIAGANVSVQGGVTTRETLANESGAYRVGDLPPGTYTVRVRSLGYGLVVLNGVVVEAGGVRTLDVTMEAIATRLNPVVVSTSRGAVAERILDSPNSISVVSAEEIETRPSVTVVDHLKAQPGLSISSGGLAQANIVSRGFNNAFSTQMLMLQDYRFAAVPSLRVNVPFLFTGTNEDIERIEVLQGPAAALYGPNSGNGVLHVITKSPFASTGTTLSIDGGTRSLFRGAFRHAGATDSERIGYKLSAETFRARDFRYIDPNEPRTYSTTDQRIPESRRGQPVVRDFDLERTTGEARLDLRPGENTELVSSVGYTRMGNALEITTTFGGAQARNWSYLNLQERFRHKQFFAQVFYNKSNSGNEHPLDDRGSFYLRTGIPVVDRSSVLVGQVQQALQLSRTRFIAGGEYIATRPQTEGTIMGRNERDDNIDEMGAYLQTTTAITSQLEFLAAGRIDVNSRIEGTQFSPRAALVFKPTPTHNFRLTFNRAFNSPASFSYFLDQYSGTTPAPGIPVQIMGNPPKSGWQFDRSCAEGVCMRSPYVPGQVGASAAATYQGFVDGGVLEAIIRGLPVSSFGEGGEAARQQLIGALPLIQGLSPTSAQVGSVLMDLNTSTPLSEVPADYAPLGANFSNTVEVGYKGILANRLRLATDVWFQRRPVEPTTQIINPAVMFNGQQLGQYLGANIAARLIAMGVPPAQAAAQAGALAGGYANIMARVPVGTAAFSHANYDQPFLVFSYQNASGNVNVWGTDFAADFMITDVWMLAATYSHLSRNVFNDAPGASAQNPLTANAAKHRASTTLRYEHEPRGYSAEVRGRYTDAFTVNSGVYNSYNIGTPVPYDPIPVSMMLDAAASWLLPFTGSPRMSLSVTNMFDNRIPTFIGVPAVGRMITTRLAYTF